MTCAVGGQEDARGAPSCQSPCPVLDAQLELGAVASFAFDKSNTNESDVEYTV